VPKHKQHRENYHLLLAAKHNKKVGVPDRGEKIINVQAMRAAEKLFWQKRGFDSPPGVTHGGVMR
jgi:hypothetical protein